MSFVCEWPGSVPPSLLVESCGLRGTSPAVHVPVGSVHTRLGLSRPRGFSLESLAYHDL